MQTRAHMHAHTSTHLTRRTVESSLQFNHRPVQQPPWDEPGCCSLLCFPGHVSSTLLASMGNNQTAGTHSGDLPRIATWALQGKAWRQSRGQAGGAGKAAAPAGRGLPALPRLSSSFLASVSFLHPRKPRLGEQQCGPPCSPLA